MVRLKSGVSAVAEVFHQKPDKEPLGGVATIVAGRSYGMVAVVYATSSVLTVVDDDHSNSTGGSLVPVDES